MSNQNEIDYEKQFREDLAKATALSLEQQALDEYNRSKKYEKARSYYEYDGEGNNFRTKDEVMREYYAQLRQRQYTHSKSYTTTTTPPTPAAAESAGGTATETGNGFKRSTSEVANSPTTTTTATSALSESDLINFNSPTSQKTTEHQTFEKLIEDLQKLQATSSQSNMQMTLVSAVPRALPAYHHQLQQQQQLTSTQYAYMPVAPYTGGLQLVPFQMSANTSSSNNSTQKTPLTNEELQKLYNMPYGAQQQQQQAPTIPQSSMPVSYGPVMGFVRPSAIVAGGAGVGAGAAYMPPQYPRHPSYNYASMQSTLQQQQQPQTSQYTKIQTNTTIVKHSKIPTANNSVVVGSNNNNNNNNNNSISSSTNSNNASNGYKPSTASGVGGAPSFVSAVRRSSRATVGDDLIDLNQDDDSRVSVLEAFDPLLNEGEAGRPMSRK